MSQHKRYTSQSNLGAMAIGVQQQAQPQDVKQEKKLGMFGGVLVPTCENMWGVIIFLRFFVIVGNAGLGMSLLIVTLSFSVAVMTALALSAIVTCGTSHSLTGVYPMLARALGKEIATATGLIYFLGIVFLAVLEVLGACEELFVVAPALGDMAGAVQMWGSILMIALVLLVGGGIKLVSKLGIIFFVVVVLTIFIFYLSLLGAPHLSALDGKTIANVTITGPSMDTLRDNWGTSYRDQPFSECLAIFFPCFTGILSGANRAGSLQDPQTAIPNGTLGAICISYCMYISLIVLWAAVGDRNYLLLDHGQLDPLIYPSVKAAQVGIIFSSLGQALQCLVVAPRLLASISNDAMLRFLRPLSVLSGGEPKRALLCTYAFAGSFVLIGSLNAIAPLLSMCFLSCYACMNMNCFVLDVLKDPHWRPRWRYFHWSIGLCGFLLCTSLMFTINWVYAIVAWLCIIIIMGLIVRSNVQTDWGSALQGLRFQIAMNSLQAIDMERHLEENWKPQLLCLYQLREEEVMDDADADPDRDLDPDSGMVAGHTHELMLSVAQQLRHGSGLIIAFAIMQMSDMAGRDALESEALHLHAVRAAELEKRRMDEICKRMGVRGFCLAVHARTAAEGKAYAMQCAGLGPLTPNTILMGWPWWWKKNPDKYVPEFLGTINEATLRGKAVLLCHDIKDFPTIEMVQEGFIDIWWIKRDGGLLLLISHLLQKHRVWSKCALRLHLIMESGIDPNDVRTRMHALLRTININASVEEVLLVDPESMLPYTQSTTLRKFSNMIAADSHVHLAGIDEDVDLLGDGEHKTHKRHEKAKDRRRQVDSLFDDGGPERDSRHDSARLLETRRMRRSTKSLAVQQLQNIEADGETAYETIALQPPQLTPLENDGRHADKARSEGGSSFKNSPGPGKSRRLSSETEPSAEEEPGAPPPEPPKVSAAPSVAGSDVSTDAESVVIDIDKRLLLAGGAEAASEVEAAEAARASAAETASEAPTPHPTTPLAQEGADLEIKQLELQLARASNSSAMSGERIPRALAEFIERHGLPMEAATELSAIFQKTVHQVKHDAPSFTWEEIHNLIEERSKGTALVIANLPDPPAPYAEDGSLHSKEAYQEMVVGYMNYIEGLAKNLRRVMYVHGAGREVIKFSD